MKLLPISVLSIALALSACNDDSSSTDITSLKDLEGIYDFSVKNDDGTIDEVYRKIASDGTTTIFDYLGDTDDQGENCYAIAEEADILTHVSGNTFHSQALDSDLSIKKDGDTYTITIGSDIMTVKKTTLLESDFRAASCSGSVTGGNVDPGDVDDLLDQIVDGISDGLTNGGSTDSEINSLEKIAGIYDTSEKQPNGTIDEYYKKIASDGTVTDFDYMGDSYDQGNNCYNIDENADTFTHVSGNTFHSQAGNADFSVVKDGDTYTMTAGNVSWTAKKSTLLESDFRAADCSNLM